MKNKGRIRFLTALIAVVLCMAAFPMTAFAGGGEEETEPPVETTTQQEPDAATINPVSLTPDGNLTLVDDIDEQQEGESLKQFITVVTKDGNYFYIIIDRVGDTENVYFLNMVDEADLLALIEDMDTTTTNPATTVVTEPEPTPEPEPTAEPEPEAEEKSSGMGGILLIVLVLAAGGGAYYYFKILKPKQAVKGGTDLSELDELDFDDGEYFDTSDEDNGNAQEDEDE